MGLGGYQGKQVQAPQVQGFSTPGIAVAQQQFESLSNRLESFSQSKFKDIERETMAQAEKDAYNDSINGKEFYSESVTTAYGRAYNNVASATFASNADLMINQRNDELLLEFENNPTAYDENMKEFVSGLSKDAPTPELQSVINISGTKLKNNTFGKLSILENNRIKAGQVETFNQEWDLGVSQYVELMSTGNTADADLLINKNKEHLGAMVDNGLITPANAKKMQKEAQFNTTNGVAQRDMESLLQEETLENAEKYLIAETSQERGDMDVDENAKHQDDLTRMFNNEVKSRNAQDAGNKEYANLIVGKVNKILSAGKMPSIELMKEAESLSDFASLAKADSLKTNIEAHNLVKQFDYMTLPEKEAKIASMKADPTGSNVSIEVLEQASKNLSSQKASAKRDPQSQSVVDGRGTLNPINISSGLNGLKQELPNRVKNQQSNLLEFGKGATQLFTPPEAKEWSSMLEDVNTPMSEKLAFMEAIYNTVPENANAVFNQLRKKGAPLFTFAASLVGEEKHEVARGVLRGQELLKAVGPQEYVTEFRTTLLGKIGNAMTMSSPIDMDALVDSALAYSVFLAEKKGDITNLKGLSERQAINDLTNGMYKRNSKDFFLPNGASKDDFDEWVDEKLTVENFADVAGMTPEQALMFTRGNRVRITSIGTGKYSLYDSLGRNLHKADGTPLILEY